MHLSIIIVSYNTAELTINCLQSVSTELQHPNLLKTSEVILVDNHSSDGSISDVKKFAKAHPQVKIQIIENKKNVGFAAANNQALKVAEGDFFWLLNSDTVVQPGAIAALLSCAKNCPELGVIAASLQNSDSTYQPQGGSLPSLLTVGVQQFFLDDLPIIGRHIPSFQYRYQQSDDVQASGWVGGTALLLKREVYTAVGPLSEAFFMYMEDVEYCIRAKKAGFGVAICHSAVVTHLGSQSGSTAQAVSGEAKGLIQLTKQVSGENQAQLMRIVIRLGAYLRVFLFGTIMRSSESAAVYHSLLRSL